jgi:hypothetical protein
MKPHERSLTFLKRVTTLALVTFGATLVFGPEVKADSCTTICEAALEPEGSLYEQAEMECPEGWDYHYCYWKPGPTPVCVVLCYGEPGGEVELELIDP